MFKFVAFFACISVALAAPGLLAEHHTVVQEPALTKVGSVVHSAPSAVSHQSFTQVHNKAVITPVIAPAVKTTVHTVEPVVPVLKSIETPLAHTYYDASLTPVVKTVHTPVLSHAVSHQSHVQLHSNAALVSPVLKSVVAPIVPVVHAVPVTHVVHH